jgi:membrane associated rhomboid family serine protease
MGIVGAWAGILAGHRHLPAARRRLIVIAVIVVVQTVFDIYTPQVSIAAHLCGLGSGVIVGLAVAPPRRVL